MVIFLEDLCMKTHTRGFNCPIIDREIISGSFQTQNWTFQERVDEICRAFLVCGVLQDFLRACLMFR